VLSCFITSEQHHVLKSHFAMNGINTEFHNAVVTETVFLFTKRHLKTKFPRYFIDEDSTYFLKRNNHLRVLKVFGDKCCEYEKYDEDALDRLLQKDKQNPSIAERILIIHQNYLVREYSLMSVYWTDRTLGNPRDSSQYQHIICVDGRYFGEFTTWLRHQVPGVDVEIINVQV
jgi:hypothetical protein